MDASPRIAALRTAKAIIGSHGIAAHMNKYNRDVLARDVADSTTGLRYDFHLDPAGSAWSDSNPSVSLVVSYTSDPNGSRLDPDGAMVVDNTLRIAIGTSSAEMNLATHHRREGMIATLGMLCEMLTTMLPPKLTLTMETPEQVAAAAKRSFEQRVGQQLFNHIGERSLKGLRKRGSPRSFRATELLRDADGKYPDTGTYHFRHVRSTTSRGTPKDIAYYRFRVYGVGDGTLPPSFAVFRINEEDAK